MIALRNGWGTYVLDDRKILRDITYANSEMSTIE